MAKEEEISIGETDRGGVGIYIGGDFVNITRRQLEFLEYINMGLPSQRDIGVAMGVVHNAVSQLRKRVEERSPELEIKFHNSRLEAAIDMYKSGQFTWEEIAALLGYASSASLESSVSYHVGGSVKNVWNY